MYGGDEGGERGEKRRAVSLRGIGIGFWEPSAWEGGWRFFCVVSFFGEEGISTIIGRI